MYLGEYSGFPDWSNSAQGNRVASDRLPVPVPIRETARIVAKLRKRRGYFLQGKEERASRFRSLAKEQKPKALDDLFFKEEWSG